MIIGIIIAGSMTGLLLGLLGSGGSIVTVPALLYLLHVAPKSAIAMSLLIVAMTAMIAALHEWFLGHVLLRVTLIFGIFGGIGTFIGARIGVLLPNEVQLGLFAIIMYAAAWRMLGIGPPWIHGQKLVVQGEEPRQVEPAFWQIPLYGMLIGVLVGIIGVGGGFLIVPALALLVHLPMKQAVGTSLSIVTIQGSVGFAGYLGKVPIDYLLIGEFAAVAIIASFIGAWISRYISNTMLKHVFGGFLIIVASYIIVKSIVLKNL